MKLIIHSFHRKSESSVTQLEEKYLGRLKPYCRVEMVNHKSWIEAGKLSKRGMNNFKKITEAADFLVVLSERGKQVDSREFAAFFSSQQRMGLSVISFIVGPAEGLPNEIESQADMKLSLSKLTLPHELARLFLLEAIYRSFDILKGGKYHK